MKRAAWLTVPAICAVLWWLGGCGIHSNNQPHADLGGSEVVGTLIDNDSAIVINALVKAFPAGVDTVAGKAADSAVSDTNGAFHLKHLPSGVYDLYGNYNGGELTVFIANVDYDTSHKRNKDTLKLGLILMFRPGAISGTVRIDKQDMSEVHCYIPGTSLDAWTDSLGAFTITMAPPGIYRVNFSYAGYAPQHIDSVHVYPGVITTIDPRTLIADSSLPPPAPIGLVYSYDTLSGVVRLTWHAVHAADMQGYNVVQSKDFGVDTFLNRTPLADTVWADTIMRQNAADSAVFIFKVQSVDKSGNTSVGYSNAVTMIAAAPNMVRTTIAFSIISGNGDSVVTGDTARIAAAYANPTRINAWIRWFSGDSCIDQHAVYGKSGVDTLVHVFADAGILRISCEIEDNGGSSWRASTNVIANESIPVDTWEACSILTRARRMLGAAVVNGVLYAMGGCYDKISLGGTSTIAALNIVEAYDPASGRWTSRASMLQPRYGFSATACQGKIYVIGGINTASHENVRMIDVYDPQSNAWDTLVRMPWARICHASACVNGKIYVVGGVTDSAGYTVTNAVDEFDPQTSIWRTVAHAPSSRVYHQAVERNGLLYLIGGIGGSATEENCTPADFVDVYDIAHGSWSNAGRLQNNRRNFAAATINGRIVIAGGYDPDNPDSALSSVEEYDAMNLQWMFKKSMAPGRYNAAAAVLKNGMVIVGGSLGSPRTPNVTAKVEKYYP